MDKIWVEGIRLFAFHGCLAEEAKIGTEYLVDLVVWGDIESSFDEDDLLKTMDYVKINEIVSKNMAIRAKLIENVAHRVITNIFNEMPIVQKVKIKLTKLYPPINGDVEKVSVELKRKRGTVR
jgi:dihydroneopterin aldolase